MSERELKIIWDVTARNERRKARRVIQPRIDPAKRKTKKVNDGAIDDIDALLRLVRKYVKPSTLPKESV